MVSIYDEMSSNATPAYATGNSQLTEWILTLPLLVGSDFSTKDYTQRVCIKCFGSEEVLTLKYFLLVVGN